MSKKSLKSAWYYGPLKEERISPSTYIKLTPEQKANIESAEIIPPKLGSKGFGSFLIRYKFPVFKGLAKQPMGQEQPQLTSETIKRMLDLQSKTLAAQDKELTFKITNDENNFKYGMANLEAQERDMQDARKSRITEKKYAYLQSSLRDP